MKNTASRAHAAHPAPATTFLLLAITAGSLYPGCSKEAPPPPPVPVPPPAAAPPPSAAANGADARPKLKLPPPPPDDGSSLMERVAKRKADEARVAAENADVENKRLLKYDRTRIRQHTALFAFEKKTRKQLDDAAAKLKGKPDAAAQFAKVQAGQRKAIVAQGKTVHAIDPKGGNSNLVTDHDVVLNALANDYPTALAQALDGDEAPLTELRAELDKREKKIEGWIKQLKTTKP